MSYSTLMKVASIAFAARMLIPLCAGAEECSDDAYPQVAQAVEAWETRTGVVVAGAVKYQVLDEFCRAGQNVLDAKKADKSSIEGAASKVINEYLDREVDSKRAGRSIGAIMRAQFGAAGFSRPQQKRSVRINFKYTKNVDAIEAGSERFPRTTALLLPVGNILIRALTGVMVVCSKQFDLILGVNAEFNC